jgi:hypothetical protein
MECRKASRCLPPHDRTGLPAASSMEAFMRQTLRFCALIFLLLATSGASASFHLFRIEQIYSNADGTVQFVVLHESFGANGENLWSGQMLTSASGGSNKSIVFPTNLPSSNTAGRRVLIASQGFAALGLVTPDYMIPNGFLPLNNGTVNYAGVDQVTYASLPTDGNAINHSGAPIPNVATNFAGASASVPGTQAPPPTDAMITPEKGLWWDPGEDGTGYNFDVKHGVLVLTMFTYESSGHSEWYLSAGPLAGNGATTTFTSTLDKYRNGQCVSCPFTGRPTLAGSDGTITITFASPTSATVNLPGNRVSHIQPQAF